MSIMDIYGINLNTGLPYQTPRTISDQNVFLGQTFTAPQLSFFDRTKNFIQDFPSNISTGVDKGIDFGKTVGSGILSAITGVPFLGNVLTEITSQFENRPLSAGVIDEFGNVYDPEELNKLNALGGYYTDPARSARRRTARIAKMLERQKLGKKISLKNLQELQRQQALQEKLRMERFEKSGRRAEVRDLQSRIDRGDFDGPSGPAASAAANQDAARGGQYG